MGTPEPAGKIGFRSGKWFAALPFMFFVVAAVTLSLKGVMSIALMSVIVIVGWLLGSAFAKSQSEYWGTVLEGMSDSSIALVAAIFLIVGIYGKIMSAGKVAQGLIYLGASVHLSGGAACAFTYIASAVFAVATGTSLGAVLTMVPVLYPAAVGLGANPMFAAAAIVSGAATGDHFAPVSDTTIISSSTQRFRRREGFADVGGVVKSRMVYVIPVCLLTILGYLVLGGGKALDPEVSARIVNDFSYAPGLFMLIPILVVLFVAMRGRTIFEALTCGTVTGAVVSVAAGILKVEDFFSISSGTAKGIIVDGVVGMFPTVVGVMTLMGSIGLLKGYGLMDEITAWLSSRAGSTPRGCEMVMFWMVTALNFLLMGSTTRITVVGGPAVDEIGSIAKIHPYRRANILDAVANSLSYIMPWHRWPFYVIGAVTPLLSTYPFLTVPRVTDFLLTAFYPILIWVMMLLAVITGYGRQFEGEGGAVVRAPLFSNSIPDEVHR